MQEFEGLDQVVSVPTTGRQISDHILSAIAAGALPVGTPLPSERELSTALQVSRSSVRAGLDRLERAGFVVRRRGRGGGTFIAPGDTAALRTESGHLAEFRAERVSLLDARAVIQGRIAYVAAQRRTDSDMALIRTGAADYAAASDATAARSADARFHHRIAQATGNPELVRIAGDLDLRINAGFRHDPFSASLFAQARDDHGRLADAIGAGAADEAGALCEAHFRSTTMQDPTRPPEPRVDDDAGMLGT